jgi:hypothetical protein
MAQVAMSTVRQAHGLVGRVGLVGRGGAGGYRVLARPPALPAQCAIRTCHAR